ncbi:hypothetical protein ACTXT7_001391 [Hymenolepis weldensis]
MRIAAFQDESAQILQNRNGLIQMLREKLQSLMNSPVIRFSFLSPQELKVSVPKETQFWSNNVEIAVGEESIRHQKKEDELRAEINQISEDTTIAIRTQRKVNYWLIDNNASLKATFKNTEPFFTAPTRRIQLLSFLLNLGALKLVIQSPSDGNLAISSFTVGSLTLSTSQLAAENTKS